jgi:hypothetical protein
MVTFVGLYIVIFWKSDSFGYVKNCIILSKMRKEFYGFGWFFDYMIWENFHQIHVHFY